MRVIATSLSSEHDDTKSLNGLLCLMCRLRVPHVSFLDKTRTGWMRTLVPGRRGRGGMGSGPSSSRCDGLHLGATCPLPSRSSPAPAHHTASFAAATRGCGRSSTNSHTAETEPRVQPARPLLLQFREPGRPLRSPRLELPSASVTRPFRFLQVRTPPSCLDNP